MARKFTKSKVIFPTDDFIKKVVYMSINEISKKWTLPVRDLGLTYAQFASGRSSKLILLSFCQCLAAFSAL